MRIKRLVGTALGTTLLLVTAAPSASASAAPRAGTTTSAPARLDRDALRTTLDAVHEAGMYGTYSSVREGRDRWAGASGLADVDTGRKVTPNMRHRVGSITKTFTAVAILQQVERGRISLDAPVTDYVPELFDGSAADGADGADGADSADGAGPVDGADSAEGSGTGTGGEGRERGDAITVRMLLNHTSHIGDYVLGAFPSLNQNSTASLDEGRFRSISPGELVRLGLAADATGTPGALPGSYSNTNYVIAGLVLEKVTGQKAWTYITRDVIGRAGLDHTSYARTPFIKGPHPKMYESFFGLIDPPRDYSVYDMSWAYTAAAIVSTTDDLNRFYRKLLAGELVGRASVAEMRRTVPMEVAPGVAIDYGLGIYTVDIRGCGRFWGHDGVVFGAGTISLTSEDGDRQVSMGWNLMKYQRVNEDGTALEPSPIDEAINVHIVEALCPAPGTAPGAGAGTGSVSKSRTAGADAGPVLPDGLPGVDLSTGGRAVVPN